MKLRTRGRVVRNHTRREIRNYKRSLRVPLRKFESCRVRLQWITSVRNVEGKMKLHHLKLSHVYFVVQEFYIKQEVKKFFVTTLDKKLL